MKDRKEYMKEYYKNHKDKYNNEDNHEHYLKYRETYLRNSKIRKENSVWKDILKEFEIFKVNDDVIRIGKLRLTYNKEMYDADGLLICRFSTFRGMKNFIKEVKGSLI